MAMQQGSLWVNRADFGYGFGRFLVLFSTFEFCYPKCGVSKCGYMSDFFFFKFAYLFLFDHMFAKFKYFKYLI